MLINQVEKSTTEKEGVYRVSKLLTHAFLVEDWELQALLQRIPRSKIFVAGGIIDKDKAIIEHEEFLAVYRKYLQCLRQGMQVDQKHFRRVFCNYLVEELADVFVVALSEEKVIVKPRRPVIQMLLHHFYPSKMDGKLHEMVMTKDSILWGLQLSMPQIFEDPHTHMHHRVAKENFAIAQTFKEIVSWLRQTALPTAFLFQGQKIRAPFRISQSVMKWVHNHPGLIHHGIQVMEYARGAEHEH